MARRTAGTGTKSSVRDNLSPTRKVVFEAAERIKTASFLLLVPLLGSVGLLEPFTPIDLESIGVSSDELTLMVMPPASYAPDNFNFRLTESPLSNTFSAKQRAKSTRRLQGRNNVIRSDRQERKDY
jgi:hypothetical protein